MTAYITVNLILHVIGAISMINATAGAPRKPLTQGVIKSALLVQAGFAAWAAALLWL